MIDWRVSGESPIRFDELFHPGVVYFSHDKLHRIAVKGVREAAKLPRAEMRRQKNDTLPPSGSILIVLEPFVRDETCDVVLV